MNLSEMIHSEEYIVWHSDRMSDICYNDPDRDTRCFKAAKEGAEGSTHAEVMNDWLDFLNANPLRLTKKEYRIIEDEIEKCWDRHDKHGSLYEEVG